ncbi:potassium channel family protein [Aliidiomarina sp. Khilg15.8]
MSISLIFAIIGALILCVVLLDLIVTTLTTDGVGPLSNWLSYVTWAGFRQSKRLFGNTRLLMVSGPVTLILIILLWAIGTWAGWFLIFSWDAITIVRDGSGSIANWPERLYYVGYTITTTGYGDFRTADTMGQIFSVVASVNGLSLLTLGVTYSIQVLMALTEKRRLAVLIEVLEPEILQCKHTSADSSDVFADELGKLDAHIASVSQKYLAYPVIHFFHDRARQASLPLKIAVLHQCLTRMDERFGERSYKLAVQIRKTETLLRMLVVNALKSHWSSTQDVTYHASRKFEGEGEAERGESALQTLLMRYVESAGWDWEKDVKAACD